MSEDLASALPGLTARPAAGAAALCIYLADDVTGCAHQLGETPLFN